MNELIASEIKITYEPQVKPANRPKIQRSTDADQQARAFFDQTMMNIREQAVVLFLNRSNRVIGGFRISSGGITSTVIDISLILGIALKCLAKGIILAHNHPSGELQPSRADQEITARLKEAAKILDITLLEHLILTEESFLSFADEGFL